MTEEYREKELIYALDIGTRSIIGIVGYAENDKFRVLAIEKEEHSKRTMLDGQIEDITQVAKVVRSVTKRLEKTLDVRLTGVCIAAAGRALHTESGHFEMSLPASRRIDHDLVSELEAGAVSNAEEALPQVGSGGARFYLVGYTVSRYLLDRYPLATLLEHSGQLLEVDVVATFLPGEVVESLYAAMRLAELEVVSLTLEPIAALNAVIPAELRLLNLVLADIGAGTTDIAVCREGSVVGYTMATVAGDEISEAIMKSLLVDFKTAERLKASLANEDDALHYTDVLGLSHDITRQELLTAIQAATRTLAEELSKRILEVNGAAPSALFLSGGGSKLSGLRELVAEHLEMDTNRVAIAGNNFQISAVSEELPLNDPEYATPLGIAVSASLGLINDSYRVTLNDEPAKLFRSGSLTALDILMMNGYSYSDLIGRAGQTVSVTIDGQRTLFFGEPSVPCVLKVNDEEMPPSTIIHTGDRISFTPAIPGNSAQKTFAEAVGGADIAAVSLLNGATAAPEQLLAPGDVIVRNVKRTPGGAPLMPKPAVEAAQSTAPATPVNTAEPKPAPQSGSVAAPQAAPVSQTAAPEPRPAVQTPAPTPPKTGIPMGEVSAALAAARGLVPAAPVPKGIVLNGAPISLQQKEDGSAYLLMDMLAHSGIDFAKLDQNVVIQVNGAEAPFTYTLNDGDSITIQLAEP